MSSALIKDIEKKILQADENYHTFGVSELSDAEYDSLKDRLRQLDPTNKLLTKIGHAVETVKPSKKSKEKEHWVKVTHSNHKMGSQSKVTENSQLKKWASKYDDLFVTQHKMDGISIKLNYKDGTLVSAITRGEGDIGEDIVRNVKKMEGIKETLPTKTDAIFRSEIILKKSKLDLVGGKTTRNSASGTAKRLDGEGCEHLTVITYSVMNAKELGLSTELEVIKFIKNSGLIPVCTYACKDADAVEEIMQEYIKSKRANLDWDIDGLVIKTNTIQDDAWDYPERSVAYKFPAEEGVTKLLDVIWQDSGGRINPVGILEPIKINGITISRATLNNIDFIQKMGIKINDLVRVSRRNDVIPCIEGVSVAAKDGETIVPPKLDADGFPIVRAKNSNGDELVYLVSTNPNSTAKRIRQITSWYEALGAKGVAEETVAAILDAGVAKDLPSFFKVGLNGHDDLVNVEGFGAGKFRILNQATKVTLEVGLLDFLNAMDITGFSEKRFEPLLEYIDKKIEISEFIEWIFKNYNDITQINGFGDNTTKALINGLTERKQLIKDMLELVKVRPWEPQKKDTNSTICGKSFCFTGSMSYDRSILELAVKKRSGIVAGVSKKLDFLVTNDPNSGSSKNEKADKLGIKKITEKEFLDMIGGKP